MPAGEKTKSLWQNPEYRKHMIETKKGKIPKNIEILWKSWKGKKHTEKAKEKMRRVRLERKERFGYINSPKTRQKMSEIRKGRIPWNKGKKGVYSKEVREKMSGALKGKYGLLSRNWKGGRTPLVKQIRWCFKYRQWRSDILTRDDFSCQLCGKKESPLEVDHYPKRFITIFLQYSIKTFQEALNCDELWNINNGRTLCKKCHRKPKILNNLI